MLFRKLFQAFLFIFLLLLILISSFYSYYSASHFYFHGPFLSEASFCILVGSYSSMFVFMVSFVTCLVLLFSEMYMDGYNNKKFTLLTILFVASMALLCVGNSFMPVMMGWDGLGLTSILLIMFYPNKVSLYNSLLTMYFNRLGDVLMVLSFSIYLMSYSDMFYFVESKSHYLPLLTFCSLIKSAQFPFSSWLPAAMSAPTPISALVHSSTLVTGGVFLVLNLVYQFLGTSILESLCYSSCLTFLLGSAMACIELDLKKIVAFSTMSQIGMVMFLLSLLLVPLSLVHMFFHALFKTLLFCCAGFIFLMHFEEQFMSKLSARGAPILKFLFFSSIYSMSGLLFCSSFYTKDSAIEYLYQFDRLFNHILLITGSIGTLLYCCKLMLGSISSSYHKITCSKFYLFPFLLLFCIATLASGDLFILMLPYSYHSFFQVKEALCLILLLFLPTIFFSNFFFCKNLFYSFTLDVGFMKFATYTQFSKFFWFKNSLEVTMSDHWVFKPSNLGFKSSHPNLFMSFTGLYFLSYFIISFNMFFWYSYSLLSMYHWKWYGFSVTLNLKIENHACYIYTNSLVDAFKLSFFIKDTLIYVSKENLDWELEAPLFFFLSLLFSVTVKRLYNKALLKALLLKFEIWFAS